MMQFTTQLARFEKPVKDKFNFTDYTDIHKPVIFWGAYTEQFFDILEHKSDIVIFWRGSDAMYLTEFTSQFLNNSHIKHIASSQFISNDLDKFNIKHELMRVASVSEDIEYKETEGNCIYAYAGNKPEFYNIDLCKEIAEELNIPIIIAKHNTYSKEEIFEVYKKCFIGLRIVDHDGFSNTATELGLLGKMCVYNGNIPNAINYKTKEDIKQAILTAKKKSNKKIAEQTKEFLNRQNKLFINYINQ